MVENKEETITVYDAEKEQILKNYMLKIMDVYPKSSNINEPFEIDADGNIKMKKVDREDDIFKNMIVPQYRVTIELVRKETNENLRKINNLAEIREEIVENQCVIMPKQIDNLQQTVVTVIIGDVNDNPPQFKDGKKLFIGYPEESVATQMALPYVAVIEVT